METTATRLSQIAWVLDDIDARRAATGDPSFGSRIEAFLIALALREVEVDIAANPGPLAPLVECMPERS